MAEGCSPLQQEDARIYPGNSLAILGRRPLSDSTIKYEENAFHDSPEVKLVHFGERRNSFSTQGSSDGEYGDTSDDGSKPSTSSRSITSTREPERSVRVRWRKGTPTAFDCDCLQSKKSKRKAAKKFTSLWTTTGLTFPVLPDNDEIKTRHRKKDLTFMNRVKKWFCDSGSPTSCESNESSFSNTPGIASKSGKSTEAELSTSRSGKKDIQRKERHYIIGDILAVTNCSYYWGSINRHEAEEVSIFVYKKFFVVQLCLQIHARIVGFSFLVALRLKIKFLFLGWFPTVFFQDVEPFLPCKMAGCLVSAIFMFNRATM